MQFDAVWKPATNLTALQTRANILKAIRDFFFARNVLEVETPLLSKFGVTDPHIHAIPVVLENGTQPHYLQTSPEYAMKRLLAAGCGAIYQICKAFRGGDSGNEHNPEFTILEWYRPGYTHFDLITEVDELLQVILSTKPAQLITYQDLFLRYLAIDPHTIALNELQDFGKKSEFNFSEFFIENATVDDWLQALFSYYIEVHLVGDAPWVVYNYPPSQAALAKINMQGDKIVAERFEVYVNGVELANGYHELCDPKQQLHRFEEDQKMRKQLNKPNMEIDQRLIAALEAGMPPCAGVALGLDRLIMLALKAARIQEVISFPIDRA